MALTESDLTEFLRLLEGDETLQLDFARAFLKERVVRKLMALDPELREAFRSAVLTEELLRLPTVVAELDQFVRQHAAQTDARFDRVEQAIEGVREELRQEFRAEIGQVREEFREGIEQVRQEFRAEIGQAREEFRTGLQRVQAEVSGLDHWILGEFGCPEDEQYEIYTVANAVTVFGYGEGGSPRRDYEVRRHLLALFRETGVDLTTIEEADSPLVADLVWWQGNRYCVVEISVKVDDHDISRAKARAETLRLAGVEVMPVVIGSAWAYDDARDEALKAGVEWRVGKEYSQGLIEYRRSQAV
jgi:hypothetical protein